LKPVQFKLVTRCRPNRK